MKSVFSILLLYILVSSIYGGKTDSNEHSVQEMKPKMLPKIQMFVKVIPKSTSQDIAATGPGTPDEKKTDLPPTLQQRHDYGKSKKKKNGGNNKEIPYRNMINNILIQPDTTPTQTHEAQVRENQYIYVEDTGSDVMKPKNDVNSKNPEQIKSADETKEKKTNGWFSWWPSDVTALKNDVDDKNMKTSNQDVMLGDEPKDVMLGDEPKGLWHSLFGSSDEKDDTKKANVQNVTGGNSTVEVESMSMNVDGAGNDDEDLSTEGSDFDNLVGSTTTLAVTSGNDVTTPATTARISSISNMTTNVTEETLPTQSDNGELLKSLQKEYATCNECMGINNGYECSNYRPFIQRLHNYISGLTSLLLFGCPGKNNGGPACCHNRNVKIEEFLIKTSRKLQEWERTLRRQCYKCPENCQWEKWGDWNVCPFTCRTGHNRTRSRYTTGPRYGGEECPPCQLEESEACPTPQTVYGEWDNWSWWTSCSSTCGGFQTRSRQCATPKQPCFSPCIGQDTQVEECGNGDSCCATADWNTWSAWTLCPETDITTIIKVRNRTCEAETLKNPLCPGQCIGVGTQVDECPSCKPSRLSNWSVWSSCSNIAGTRLRLKMNGKIPPTLIDPDLRACSGGCRKRKRSCIKGTCPSKHCFGRTVDTVSCYLGPCCVPADWSLWSHWSSCDGSSCQTRSKHCQVIEQAGNMTHPRPMCRKVGCWNRKPEIETKDCPDKCVNGSWGVWSPWGTCSANCDQQRSRLCDSPRANFCGRRCVGQSSQIKGCDQVNGSWGMWSPWSTCSANCDQQRSRLCDSPRPNSCGRKCVGQTSQIKGCDQVNGSWGMWSPWSTCSANCDQQRSRLCDSPRPNSCGRKCVGQTSQIKGCDQVNGSWGVWSPWSTCGANCKQRSSRSCDNPRPNSCGRNCVGETLKTKRCDQAVDGQWGLWSSWSECSVPCGLGNQSRSRVCDNPTANICGKVCAGRTSETRGCQGRKCCDNGVWGGWTPWSGCYCNNGTRSRVRSLIPASRGGLLCNDRTEMGKKMCTCCSESCQGLSDGFHLAKCRNGIDEDLLCRRYIKCCNGALKGPVATCRQGQIFYPGCQNCAKGNGRDCRRVRSGGRSTNGCRLRGMRPIEESPCCMEDCGSMQKNGFFASKCKTDCKAYYQCCEGSLVSTHHCGDNFYHAQCGCCVKDPSMSCINDVETYTGKHRLTAECEQRLCISYPKELPIENK